MQDIMSLADKKKNKNIVGKLEAEDLNPTYYVHEAKALSDELKQGTEGFMSDIYAHEKMRHLCEIFEVAYRHENPELSKAMAVAKSKLK